MKKSFKQFCGAFAFIILSILLSTQSFAQDKEFHLTTDVFTKFSTQWALLTAGNKESFNSMTIGWGMLGTIWRKPSITVYVKQSRHTYKFMNKNEYFTVSFFPEQYRKSLAVMGTKSGRDCDKPKEASLTPKFLDNGVTYEEAEMTLVCKKVYYDDMIYERSPESSKHFYPPEDPLQSAIHRMYIGEIVDIIEKPAK